MNSNAQATTRGNVSAAKQAEARRRIALDYLRRVAEDSRRIERVRLEYLRNARRHGVSIRAMAQALAVTALEVRIRLLFSRGDG